MNPVTAPDSVDIPDFQFKLHRRVRIFDSKLNVKSEPLDLIATASSLGLLFIGSPDNSLRVLQLKNVVEGSDSSCPQRIICLSSPPTNVSLNCDCTLLSVVIHSNDTPSAIIYNTKSLITENPVIQCEIRLSPTPNIQLCRLLWNPCQSDSLAICMSDGSLSVYICKSSSVELQTKVTNARCLSWSPKGKQIVTGDSDGTLNQYKPDLTLVKTIPPAKFFPEGKTSALAIHWISNYQFCVVFEDSQNPDNRPCIAIVNTPKGGSVSYINYDDICYSMGDCRENQYFILHLSAWNVILASSANSMEIGVLGTSDQNNWLQWTQIDEARAELPLTEDKQESYPIGISFDNCALLQLPWGDGQILPHMPMLHVLTHTGMLISYYMINLIQNAPNICITPENLNIPTNLLSTKSYQNEVKQKMPTPTLTSYQDISFTATTTMTSTPTVPKFVPSAPNKSISTNLFGKINESLKNNSNETVNKPQFQPSNILPKKDNPATFSETKHEKSAFQEFQNKVISQPTKQDSVAPIKNTVSDNKKYSFQNGDKSFEIVVKSMLLSEVNSFQKEIFELLQKCKRVNIEIGNFDEMNKISTVLSSENQNSIKWSDEDIKKQMVILKHNLINTCAFLAEARMQPASLELEQLAQLDPASAGKMNTLKLTLYYLESQFRQVNNSLDEQWETFQNECRKKSAVMSGFNDNDYMKMPTLEKIYQPLLKQSEILVKQHNIVSSLQKTLDSMDLSNISKNSNRNVSSKISKGDDDKNKTLSLLSSGLSNLNIRSGNIYDGNKNKLKPKPSQAKYDSLRQCLLNHKTTKIKTTKIDIHSQRDWNTIFKKNKQYPDISHKNDPATSMNVEKCDKMCISTQTDAAYTKCEADNSLPIVEKSISLSFTPNINSKITDSVKSSVSFDKPNDPDVTKPFNAAIFQNIFAKSLPVNNKSIPPEKPDFPNSSQGIAADPKINLPNSKTSTIPSMSSSFKTYTNIPVTESPSESSTKLEKETPTNSSLFKNISKPIENSTKLSTSTSTFITTTTSAPVQLKNFSFSFSPAISSAFSSSIFKSSSITQPIPNSESKTITFQIPAVSATNVINITAAGTFTTVSTSSNYITTSANTILTPKVTASILSNIAQTQVFNSATKVSTPSTAQVTFNAAPLAAITTQSNDKPNSAIFNSSSSNLSLPATLNIIPPNVSLLPNKPSADNELKSDDTTAGKKTEISNTSIAITSETIATPIEKTLGEFSFGTPKPPETTVASAVVLSTPAFISSTTSTFSSTAPNTFTTTSSSLLITPVSSPTTQISVFGTPQQTTSSFSSPNLPATPIFGSPSSTSTSPQDIFKTAVAANTCASSLFGAASAAIDTSVASLFGSTSISTTSAQSPFNNANNTTNSIFGSGSSVFGGQTAFSTSSSSIFGGSASSGFGQPQSNVFGGGTTFGGFGTQSPSSNIFGQAAQTSNTFGAVNNSNQGSVFGSNPVSNNTFGSSAPIPQQSVFGSPTTLAAPVFGGSPTFGSKPAFGQAPSFSSSPQGSFGMFGSNDQSSIAQTGFGSPGGFNKPSGAFGGSPKFGGSPSFGAPPAFGATPSFGTNVNNSFGSPSGFGTGTQQSSTFESLASQSTLSFGNLAQQTQQQAPQSSPIFQSSSSFSTWR